jgi:hypothetical protein
VPFKSTDDPEFKRAIVEIYILQELNSKYCPNITRLEDFFIKEWDVSPEEKVQCVVLVFEPFEASLEEIGIYRTFSANTYWSNEEMD